MTFTKEELKIIRELLSAVSCGYERTEYYHDCCDGNEIIKKIDDRLALLRYADIDVTADANKWF